LGDLNYDGKVNSTDYLVLKRYLLGTIDKESDPNFLKAADLNRDGRVNSTDMSLMKRYLLGIITSFLVK